MKIIILVKLKGLMSDCTVILLGILMHFIAYKDNIYIHDATHHILSNYNFIFGSI